MPKGVFKRKPFTIEHIEHLRKAHLGQVAWNKGLKTGLVPKTAFKKGDLRISGVNNPNWIGGEGFDGRYMRKTTAPNKRKRSHRLIMERYLGRDLTFNEVVHHINRNKLDNRVENLQLMTRSEHTRLHQLP